MNYNAHLAGGLIGSTIVPASAMLFNKPDADGIIVGMVAVLFGSLFSDLDTKSTITKWYAMVTLALSCYWFYVETPVYSLFLVVPFLLAQMSVHRGWTHAWTTIVILMLLPNIMHFAVSYLPDWGSNVSLFVNEHSLIIKAFAFGICVHNALDKRHPFDLRNWRIR